MSSDKLDLFIDVGDIYTKFMIVYGGKLIKRDSFLSAAALYPPAGDFYEVEERIYSDGKNWYLAGWPATLTAGCSTLTLSPETDICQIIIHKILSDEVDSGKANVLFSIDIGRKAEIIEELAGNLDNRILRLRSRLIYEEEEEGKSIKLNAAAVPAPLCMFDYIRDCITDKIEKDSVSFIVDMGYARNKMFAVSHQKGVEDFTVDENGINIFYDEIAKHFKEEGIQINKFLIMKELELNYPYITHESGVYSVDSIVKNIRCDLCKDIVVSIINFVTGYYEKHGKWMDYFVLTGGGAVLNGELIKEMLISKDYHFKNILFDDNSIYSLLEGMRIYKEKEDDKNKEKIKN